MPKKKIVGEARTCKMSNIMHAWSQLDELLADYDGLSNEELVRLRKTMRKRAEDGLDALNDACKITDKDVQYWTED